LSSQFQPTLIVTFEEARYQVTGDEPFTFGRAGTLRIDDTNRELHRVQGVLRYATDTWWLFNHARSTSMVVTHLHSPSFSRVAPASATALPWGACAITFSAGKANYRIEVDDPHRDEPSEPDAHVPIGDATLTSGQLIFNEEQFQLLAVISEPRIAGPISEADLYSNRQIAQRLGWSLTKVNRKLDNLCIKLDKAGIQGLRGDIAGAATQRRLNLANFGVESGLITGITFEL